MHEVHSSGVHAVPVENPKIVSKSCTLLPLKQKKKIDTPWHIGALAI